MARVSHGRRWRALTAKERRALKRALKANRALAQLLSAHDRDAPIARIGVEAATIADHAESYLEELDAAMNHAWLT